MYYDYILVFINYLMKFGGFQPTLSNFTGTFLANTDEDPPSVSFVNVWGVCSAYFFSEKTYMCTLKDEPNLSIVFY